MANLISSTKNFSLGTALFVSLLASNFAAPAAQAQYMVIEGNTTGSFGSQINSELTNQTIFVQDYNDVSGISSFNSTSQSNMTSTDILNGMFDGFIGVFGACIGIPAIIIAVLRLFVKGQTARPRKKNKSFALPAAPEPARYIRPSLQKSY